GFVNGLVDLLSASEAVQLVAKMQAEASLNKKALEYTFDLPAALASMAETKIDATNGFNDIVPIYEDTGVYRQSVAGVSSFAGLHTPALLAPGAAPAGDELAAGTLKRLRQGAADWMTGSLVPVAEFVAHGIRHKFPNDGVVRVSSSRWGRFRGCVLADHMGVV